jgi:hypothetical protein
MKHGVLVKHECVIMVKQFDELRKELIYPDTEYKATYTICECGNYEWRFIG